ncbi:hypothetical protein LTR84_011489 [Exophiala bonariae]|uniref:Major facilitator superfamily (MFS) profile domain-containing protein n=1 Tax=Exophiala bonariae TaxID=1690606 RepID=A0AAV9NJT3_9EURO|nr:hypothetical protein LTR84_011489 [Exophiala bonariae]
MAAIAQNQDPSSQLTTAAGSPASSVLKVDMQRDAEKNEDEAVAVDPSENKFNSSEKQADSEKAAEEPPVPQTFGPMHPSQFPDGGTQAWLVVFGGFIGLVVSFGWINCVGVFQEYYQSNQLREYSSQEVAWIPSLEAFMMFFGGLWIGRIYDNYGPTYILVAGGFFHVFGLMMTSLSTKYYQFILAQGVCSPFGCSMIFYPCMSATSTWFFKRRALALGLVASGSSIGGVVLPIMVQRLIPRIGFAWTMRACAFIILGLTLITIFTVKSRFPPVAKPVKVQDFLDPWKEASFALLSLGSFLTFLGVFIPFTFVIVAARGRGVPEDLAKYLVPILNASSTFGRTIPNYYADKVGRFTVFVASCFITTIFVLAIWLPASGSGAIVTFTVVFGFSSGAVFSLLPACLAQISDIQKIGVRNGVLFSVNAVAVLIGSPIAGQLIIGDHGRFRTMQGFSGAMLAAGFMVYLALWIRLGGLKKGVKI